MIYLVRHGETTANAGGLVQGQRDPDLTALGREQAAALVDAVPQVERVICSPLRRARTTADAFGCPLEIDRRWIEINFGEYEYRPVGEVREQVWPKWRDDPAWAPSGGESLDDVSRRVVDACDSLAPRAAGEDVVVVTHVTPIKLAVAWALGVSPAIAGRMWVGLASITTIEVRPDGLPLLVAYNDRAHLVSYGG